MNDRTVLGVTQTNPFFRKWRLWICLGIVMTSLGIVSLVVYFRPHEVDLPAGVSREEYSESARRFEELFGGSASREDVVLLLGETAVSKARLPRALACFRAIPIEHPEYGLPAKLQEAQVLLQLNRVRESEQSFQEFLSRAKGNPSIPLEHTVSAQKWLVFILSVEFRFEERKALLAEMHDHEASGVWESKLLYFPHLLIWNSPAGRTRLNAFLKENPGDIRLLTAEGRYLTLTGHLAEALSLLEELHQQNPKNLRCAAALLECYFEGNDWVGMGKVIRSLPPNSDGQPWLLSQMRGHWAMHAGRYDQAVAHFDRVLQADPSNPTCHMALASAYGKLQRAEERDDVLRRSLVLSRIRAGMGTVQEADFRPSLKLAAACREIELLDAASTFQRHAWRIQRGTQERSSASLKGDRGRLAQ